MKTTTSNDTIIEKEEEWMSTNTQIPWSVEEGNMICKLKNEQLYC